MNTFGMHFVGSRPANPNPGDTYVHESDGFLYSYDGRNWLKIQPMVHPSPVKKMIEQLGEERVRRMLHDIHAIEQAAEENELIRVLWNRVRVAAKLSAE